MPSVLAVPAPLPDTTPLHLSPLSDNFQAVVLLSCDHVWQCCVQAGGVMDLTGPGLALSAVSLRVEATAVSSELLEV